METKQKALNRPIWYRSPHMICRACDQALHTSLTMHSGQSKTGPWVAKEHPSPTLVTSERRHSLSVSSLRSQQPSGGAFNFSRHSCSVRSVSKAAKGPQGWGKHMINLHPHPLQARCHAHAQLISRPQLHRAHAGAA